MYTLWRAAHSLMLTVTRPPPPPPPAWQPPSGRVCPSCRGPGRRCGRDRWWRWRGRSSGREDGTRAKICSLKILISFHYRYWYDYRWIIIGRNGNNKFYPRVIFIPFLLYLPRSRKTISSSLSIIRVSGWLSPSIRRKSMIFDVSSKQAWFSSEITTYIFAGVISLHYPCPRLSSWRTLCTCHPEMTPAFRRYR